jgi:hypothetical protein
MGSEALASAAVNETLLLGGKIATVLKDPAADLQGWLASERGRQRVLSKEMIAFATSHVGDVNSPDVPNKLAFLILSAQPGSSTARLIETIARKTFARSSAALIPFVELGDLVSMLRWKLWNLSSDQFTAQRILKHPGLAAYISVVARSMVIDECRALSGRVRVSSKQWNVEAALDPRTMIDAVLDDLDVLRRVAQDLPAWERPLLTVMADQIERTSALDEINRDRQAADLPPWTMDSLRTALHRLRTKIREAVAEVSPSPRP